MRKITNRNNLPETLVIVAKDDSHWNPGDISVTTLIDAPQKRLLKKQLGDYTEDVSDMMYAIFGTAVHQMLELANIPSIKRRAFMLVINELTDMAKEEPDAKEKEKILNAGKWLFSVMEKRFPELAGRFLFEVQLSMEVDGWILTGTLDIYDTVTKLVQDYKVCSTYQYMNPESQKKWLAQLNVYCFMLTKHGYEVEGAEIIAIFRDHSKAKVLQNKAYPPHQVMRVKQQMFSVEQMAEYIIKRIKLHKDAQDTGDIPDCTPSERWAQAGSFTAMVPTSTKAKKANLGDKEIAERWIQENRHKYPGLYLEQRDADYGRFCKEYCLVKDICPQKKRLETEQLKMSSAT